MELSREQLKGLSAALCAAFPSSADLKRMIRFELGENPNIVAGEAPNLAHGVYNLIEWALAHDKMADLIHAAVEANPDNTELRPFARIAAQFYVDKADGHSRNEEYDVAISNYNHATDLDPQFAKAYNNRGNTYRRMTPPQNEAAVADYNRAIELDADFAKAYNNRGDTYLQLAPPNYDASIADYTEATRIQPDFLEAQQNLPWAYYDRGRAYRKQRSYDKAIADFTETLKINSEDIILTCRVYLQRGDVYSVLHKDNEALSDFDEVISLLYVNNSSFRLFHAYDSNSKNAFVLLAAVSWAHFRRGNIYHEQGRYKTALLEYNSAEEVGLAEQILYRSRSKTYAALGRQAEAEADLVQAQQVEKANSAFRRVKELLN